MIVAIKEPYQQQYEISEEDLSQKVKTGSIDPDNTYIWHEGLTDWILLKLWINKGIPSEVVKVSTIDHSNNNRSKSDIKKHINPERIWISALALLYILYSIWYVNFTGIYKKGVLDPRISSIEHLITTAIGVIFGALVIPITISILWSTIKRFIIKSHKDTLMDRLKVFTIISIISLLFTSLGAHSSSNDSMNAMQKFARKDHQINSKTDAIQKNSDYIHVNLPKGSSILLPKNWTILSNQQKGSIEEEKSRRLSIELVNATSDLSFAANYFYPNNRTAALLNIRFYPNITVTQAESEKMGIEDIQSLDSVVHENINKAEKISDWTLIEWRGTKRQIINGNTAFVSEYTRTGINDSSSFCTRLVRFFRGSESYTLTIGYRIEDESTLRPICDKIISSIKNN
jgi:hypothetical protein